MTCHIALSNETVALLFSDSQTSTDTSERHGLQKQFAGPDFLLGIAGLSKVRPELFDRLDAAIQPGKGQLRAADLPIFLEEFTKTEIRSETRRHIGIITVVPPDEKGSSIRIFNPGVFSRLGRRTSFGAIGSGAEFVKRAYARYKQLGINIPLVSLADLVVAVEDFAKAANESLTVDDSFLLGLLANGKSYLLGDHRIRPEYAPAPLQQQWSEATTRFHEMMEVARVINGEMINVQQQLSVIRAGALTEAALDAIRKSHNDIISPSRQTLGQQLQEYFVWYDGILRRT